jgi:hypothetical protein
MKMRRGRNAGSMQDRFVRLQRIPAPQPGDIGQLTQPTDETSGGSD